MSGRRRENRVRRVARIAAILLVLSAGFFALQVRSSGNLQPGNDGAIPVHGVHIGFMDVTRDVGLHYRLPKDGEDREDGEDGKSDTDRNREDGGLVLFDIDGDGGLALHVSHGHGARGRLFRWNGERFVRIQGNSGIRPTAIDRAGYFIELDGDGLPDFLSVHAEGIDVFQNLGGGRFGPSAGPFGTQPMGTARSMAAADYDNDGDLDLFVAHWDRPWIEGHDTQHLWRNNGRGGYEDMSRTVPIRPIVAPGGIDRRYFSFTPVFSDIDSDGDPDILLTGDFRSSQVLRNDGIAGFVDITGPAVTDENGMGSAVGDFDGDGSMDWFVTSVFDREGVSGYGPTGNRLYRNHGNGSLADATDNAGVRDGGWGWGACIGDFDNDGNPDLFQTNGWFSESWEDSDAAAFRDDPSRLFLSNGDGSFTEMARELGISHTGQGRGAVCADYDRDGRVDILVANHGAAPTVYRNVSENGNRWLSVKLEGQPGNPRGIGAVVSVHADDGRRQVKEVRLGGSYLSQQPPTLHFGLGGSRIVRRIEVAWPGPGRAVTQLQNVETNRRLAIHQPEPAGLRLLVTDGTGTGIHREGAIVEIRAAAPPRHYHFSHWSSEGGGMFADVRSAETAFTMPGNDAAVFAHYLPGPASTARNGSVARRWMEVLLQAIRDDPSRPTVHARNLLHLSAAMYDAWVLLSGQGRPWALGQADLPCDLPEPLYGGAVRLVHEKAISHAARRILRHRFRDSPGAVGTLRNADTLLAALGYETGGGAEAAAELGHCIAGFYITRGLADGSNEANDYASTSYRPVNPALDPSDAGNPSLMDANRWQPLWLESFTDQSGHLGGNEPVFVSPEWGRVTPFALSGEDLTVRIRDGMEYRIYHDPGPPPTLHGPTAVHYKWGFALVGEWSSHLSPEDGVLIDIAPSSTGNVGKLPGEFADYPRFFLSEALGRGHPVNPTTGRAYRPQLVQRGDWTRALAEFWADGPGSETPPGHWFTILNQVGEHERLVRRIGGKGPLLDSLEWDLKSYLALGGAMHDSAVAAWGIKGWYDYIRPISAIRHMAEQGQSSDPSLPSWSAEGIPLSEGFVELVEIGDPLAGDEGEHAGKIRIRAWRGPRFVHDPAAEMAGVGWILAENWMPYQRPSFVTPPFAGYVSGHSTFSRAAAEILAALTGDPFFPGGMGEFPVPANSFLKFERGPDTSMVLQWATYRDAADQCGLSRIWGGIHPPADDIKGRIIGTKVGRDAFRFAVSLWAGVSEENSPGIPPYGLVR